jgi:hypothetical protein
MSLTSISTAPSLSASIALLADALGTDADTLTAKLRSEADVATFMRGAGVLAVAAAYASSRTGSAP